MSSKGLEQRLGDIEQLLDVIHGLVNSNLTASMRAELEATIRDRASMAELVEIKRAAGHEPSKEALQAIEAADARVAELRASLGDRMKATEIAARE
jgi:hypothetical protein